MKRILSLILLVAMIASLGVTAAFAADDGFVDGKFTETRHITVEIFNRNNDGGTDPTNNVWTEYIKKQMLDRYNVEVEFAVSGRWSEPEDLATALASSQAPDIIYTYSCAFNRLKKELLKFFRFFSPLQAYTHSILSWLQHKGIL